MSEPVLDAKKVAEILRVSTVHIYNLAKSGQLKGERIDGRHWRFSLQAVASFERRPRGLPSQAQCKRGHDMSGDNVGTSSSGGRSCKACMRERARKAVRS